MRTMIVEWAYTARLEPHDVHHRSQVTAMLRDLGTPLQDFDDAYFMYRRREAPTLSQAAPAHTRAG
jgi:hypothetical protein